MRKLFALPFLIFTTVTYAEVIRQTHLPAVTWQSIPAYQQPTHLLNPVISDVMGQVIAVQPNMSPGPLQHMVVCEQQRNIGGAILGALGGAVIGSKMGGDIGAVVGGIAGMAVGDNFQNSGQQVCGTRAVQMQTITSYTVRVKAWNGPMFLGVYDIPMNHQPPLGVYVKLGR